MKLFKKILVIAIKKLDLGSAVAVKLTKLTGKSKVSIHPKHFLNQEPWFTEYINSNDAVIDLGSGNGQNAIKAAKFAKKVIACDIDKRLINQAKASAVFSKIKNIRWEKTDLERELKFRDASFDKVLFLDVLEHLKNRDQILSEIRRIIAPGGLLFLGVPNSQTSWKKFQRSAGVCSFSDPDHKIEFSQRSIKAFLKKHKFKIIKFGYGKFDIPARGLLDIAGALSLAFYKLVSEKREKFAQTYPNEASGFEIIAQKL